MEKIIPRKAVVSTGEGAFREGASRKKRSDIEEDDMLNKPLPKGNMLGSSAQPITKGQIHTHYNRAGGAIPTIPAGSELGSNR